MPFMRIETNVPKKDIPQDFLAKAAGKYAETLGKPAEYCVVSVIPDTPMSFSGTTGPCAIASLMSTGAFGVEQNKKHAKAIFELVEKELGVPSDRMYISFQNQLPSDVGFKGTTFHELLNIK